MQGISRSATVAAAYLMEHGGLHIDKATDEQNVKEKAAREAMSGMTREGSIPGEMALIN